MKPKLIYGGFFFGKYNSRKEPEFENRLQSVAQQYLAYPDNGIYLAAWKDFDGQGLWSNQQCAVAYDLDLINRQELADLVDLDVSEDGETGHLLWLLYEKYGMDLIDKMRGAFSFVIWDRIQEKIIVFTDSFGIRPIVFLNEPGKFIVASRIRQIMLDHSVSREINSDAIYCYLFFHAICSPLTVYKKIHKLEPGRGLIYDRNEFKEFTHYDIRYKPDLSKSKTYWIEKIPAEVEIAVGKLVPLSEYDKTGCFLSGGTDSSSIAGYYTKIQGRPAKTFSIGFEETAYNELGYARIASKRYGTQQFEYIIKPEEITDFIFNLPKIFDEPFGNASVVPAYFCASFARKHGVDVLLGGDGGDEIFGGNERYVTNLLFEKYHLLPFAVRKSLVEPLLRKLPNAGLFFKAKRYIRRANIPNPERFFSYNLLSETDAKTILDDEFIANINTDCFMELARLHFEQADPSHVTDRLLYIDMKFTITDNDLRKVNQMAEAAGVRVRYPFLDRELVDFTATIPPNLKVKFGKNRYIFKQAMKSFLPREIIKKQKHGMGLPIAAWFKTDTKLIEMLKDSLFSGDPHLMNYIKPDFIDDIKHKFEHENSPFYGDNLWIYLMLELWLKNKDVQHGY